MGLRKSLRRGTKWLMCWASNPAAWSDSLCIAKLRRLKPMLNGRRIAVVGNAESIFAARLGAEIDACDVVIRMNRGVVRSAVSQGSRTDILCTAADLTAQEVASTYGRIPVIWTSDNRWKKLHISIARWRPLYFVPREHWLSLQQQLPGKAPPSAGLVTIAMLIRYFNPAEINLFGFDWMATNTFYNARPDTSNHSWTAERALILRWLGESPSTRKIRPDLGPAQSAPLADHVKVGGA